MAKWAPKKCHYFQKGTCRNGDKCKFDHTLVAEGDQRTIIQANAPKQCLMVRNPLNWEVWVPHRWKSKGIYISHDDYNMECEKAVATQGASQVEQQDKDDAQAGQYESAQWKRCEEGKNKLDKLAP